MSVGIRWNWSQPAMSDDVDFNWDSGKSPAELAAKFDELDDVVEEKLEEAMTTVVLKIEADASRKAPIDTGNLRGSIEGIVLGWVGEVLEAAVGSPVEYSQYQEFGTRYMDPNPYLEPAIEENRDWAYEQFEAAIQESVNEVFG